MKVFNYLTAAALALMTVATVSCSDSKDESEIITINHIYLSVASGNTSIVADSGEEVVVTVNMSSPLKESATFEFEATGPNASYVTLEDNPVTIPANSAVGSFTVKAAEGVSPETSVSVTFSVKNLDANKYDLRENVSITVMPASSNLSEAEKALVNSWKSKYGVDLTPWIGTVNLTGEIQFPGSGNLQPFTAPEKINLSGASIFAISSESDAETPVLDMIENPMGMADYLYKSFIALTVGDKEYFALEDEGNGLELMNLINWSSTSEETFAVTLPGLKITSVENGKATVEFVVEGPNYILNSKGEKIYSEDIEDYLTYNFAESRVPFTYTYSAWSRQLDLVEQNDPSAIELLSYGVSAAPASYLGMSPVNEDEWDIDEEEDGVANLYVYPKGEIDFNNGTMTFEFPFDHADQLGYSRVTVTYSLTAGK